MREAEAALEVARAKVLAERAALDIAAAELAVERSRLKMAAARGESASARLLESERSFRRSEILAKGATLAQTHVDQASTAYLSAAAELRATEAETKAVYRFVGAMAVGMAVHLGWDALTGRAPFPGILPIHAYPWLWVNTVVGLGVALAAWRRSYSAPG